MPITFRCVRIEAREPGGTVVTLATIAPSSEIVEVTRYGRFMLATNDAGPLKVGETYMLQRVGKPTLLPVFPEVAPHEEES